MIDPPLLDGLRADMIDTARLRTHLITAGPNDGEPIMLVHGNCSAARFWEATIVALADRYRVVAPDLRGYGRTEALPLDATRGVADFGDDLHALLQALNLHRPHLVGWSLGGAVVMQYAMSHPANVASLTLVAPASPYGFGGTRDMDGTLTAPDARGSGGGTANVEFVQRLQAGDRSANSAASPRSVMNALYWKPPFRSPREDVFVDEILTTAVGPDNYPGDSVAVNGWPGTAPGTRGVLNALSPKYLDLSAFAAITPRPPVLWMRGDNDAIVSDTSLSEFGYLGQIGAVPGWPGPDVFPPQPMVTQTRAVLDAYAANGGDYREVVVPSCGHSPHIEHPDAFNKTLLRFLEQATSHHGNASEG